MLLEHPQKRENANETSREYGDAISILIGMQRIDIQNKYLIATSISLRYLSVSYQLSTFFINNHLSPWSHHLLANFFT